MAHYKIKKKPGESITLEDIVKKLHEEIAHSCICQNVKFAGGYHFLREKILTEFLDSLMEDINLNIDKKREIING